MRRNRKPSHAELLARLTERLHIMRAIEDSLARWPEVSALAWEADSADEFVVRLGAVLGLDEIQATAVSELQLRRLPQEQRARIRAEVDDLEAELADLRSTDPS